MISAEVLSLIAVTYSCTIKLVGFFLGYRIVVLGATLLRDGITGQFTFSADLKGAKADLASASPGLLFLLLGAILIGIVLFVPKTSSFSSGTVGVETSKPPTVPIPSG